MDILITSEKHSRSSEKKINSPVLDFLIGQLQVKYFMSHGDKNPRSRHNPKKKSDKSEIPCKIKYYKEI